MLSLPQSVAEPQSIAQNTTTTTTHIWLGSEIAFDIQDDAVVKYLHGIKLIELGFGLYLYDAHGNVTELLDNEYNVVQSYTYDPFGIENGAESSIRDTDMAQEMSIGGDMLIQSPDINGAIDDPAGLHIQQASYENPYRYCGEYFDNETGYVYLRARYYAPTLGRFISEDTAKDGYNWYVYCGNDPVNYVDPSGEVFLSLLATVLIGAAVGGALGVTFNGLSNINSGKDFFDNWGFALLEGALSGAIAGTGWGIGWQIGLNAVVSGGVDALKQVKNGGNFNVGEVLTSSAIGAGAAFIGGAGAQLSKIGVTQVGMHMGSYTYRAGVLLSGELAGRKLAQSFTKVFFYNCTKLVVERIKRG